jgi:hypothetical protein
MLAAGGEIFLDGKADLSRAFCDPPHLNFGLATPRELTLAGNYSKAAALLTFC